MNRAARGLYSSYASPTDYEPLGEEGTGYPRAIYKRLHAFRAFCINYFFPMSCFIGKARLSGTMTERVLDAISPIWNPQVPLQARLGIACGSVHTHRTV
jgi:hypothetical protein